MKASTPAWKPPGSMVKDWPNICINQGWQVSVVNPARIKAYANSKLRRNKTDKADAQLIAEYCLREKPALWSPPPASFKDLQALVRRLEDLQGQLSAGEQPFDNPEYTNPVVIEDIKDHLQYLEEQIKHIKQAIQDHIDAYPELKQRQESTYQYPGNWKVDCSQSIGRDPRCV